MRAELISFAIPGTLILIKDSKVMYESELRKVENFERRASRPKKLAAIVPTESEVEANEAAFSTYLDISMRPTNLIVKQKVNMLIPADN